jgi:predicted  nucleic acid-binding Zn-ribbon protein
MTNASDLRKIEIAQSALDNMTNEIWALRRKVEQLEHERDAANARAEAAERKLAEIAELTDSVIPAMRRINPVTMEASSAVQRLFTQGRLALERIEAIAKGE